MRKVYPVSIVKKPTNKKKAQLVNFGNAPRIKASPKTISNMIMATEKETDILESMGNIGAKKEKAVSEKVDSNSVK